MFDFFVAAAVSAALPSASLTSASPAAFALTPALALVEGAGSSAADNPAVPAPAADTPSDQGGPSAWANDSSRSPVFFSAAARLGNGLGASGALSLWVPVAYSCGHGASGVGFVASLEGGLFGAQADLGFGAGTFADCDGWYRQYILGYAGAASVLHQWRNLTNDLAEPRTLVGGVLTFSPYVTIRPGFYVSPEDSEDRLFTLALGFGL